MWSTKRFSHNSEKPAMNITAQRLGHWCSGTLQAPCSHPQWESSVPSTEPSAGQEASHQTKREQLQKSYEMGKSKNRVRTSGNSTE